MTDYAFVHDGRAYTPNQTMVLIEDVERHNAEQERAELARWNTSPDRMVAYYDAEHVTTWKGTVLGRIVSARVFRHNFGSRMITIHAIGTNGAKYYGRASYDSGSIIRLRKVKG